MKYIDLTDITREDILKAFKKYDELKKENKLNYRREAKKYLLFWNSKEYPPKYIVGLAYELKYGKFLDTNLYYATGDHKGSAEWCLKKNGFVLFEDETYKKYLESKYDNKKTINTYYSDLKKAIKIFQKIDKFKDKNLNEILDAMQNNIVSFEEYDKAQKELGYDDKELFKTLKTKAKLYLDAINSKKGIKMNNTKFQKYPLNQILYGPPGTGKTYESIRLAVEIIDNKTYDNEKDREIIKQRFKELKDLGQIEFVTFHQSFSYEDFVEGIKPDLESKELKYKIEDGIFKRIADKAKENFENSSKDNYIDFDSLITDFANFVENNKPFSLRKGRNGDVLVEEVNFDMDGNFISFTLGGSVTSKQRLTKEVIKRDIKNFIDGLINLENDVKPTNQSRSIKHGNAGYYYSLYEKIKKFFKENNKKFIKNKEPLKNYILIIDEINRGNISKIFGELITLIEKDKRLGEKEELTVRLPYSKKEFGVPNNLYIIGTMNTADKSLVFLDSALRRRFVFKAYYPKPNELDNREIAGMNLTQFLEKINKKIVKFLDKDHQIGHSYFININIEEDLKDVLANQILPLLEEYFFDEEDKIKEIFGVDEVKVDKIIEKFSNNENNPSN